MEQDAEEFFRVKLENFQEPSAPFDLLDVSADPACRAEAGSFLDPELSQRIRTQAYHHSITPDSLFHAAWALIVSRTAGPPDVAYGTTVCCERHRGEGGALRMGVNTLPLGLHLQGVSARELIQQVHSELTQLQKFAQVPLTLAQRRSGISGAAPLLTSLLSYISDPETNIDSNFPISIIVVDSDQDFRLTARVRQRLDPKRLIGYVVTALRSLVEALERAPQTPALSLSVLPQSERDQVLRLFNEPQAEYSQESLIHELFEEQVRRAPGAVAVVYEGQSLTYADLNAKADQLARYLRRRGIGPDHLVGLCVERSLEMVVGLLGILKAGGAYVPLDPNYPPDRLAYMLADAAPAVLLTQGKLRESLPESAAEVIALDEQWGQIEMEEAVEPSVQRPATRSYHLAYVIYTSGSTGKPKGVMVEHRNVTRLFAATQERFGFNSQDVWTLFHSVAFDFSVWELWGALLYGGRVVVVPYLTARSPQEFYRLVCSEKVTVLNQTPSAFAQLIDAQGRSPQEHHSLRVVIFGGEALELRALRPWVERNGVEQTQLVNMYGITETTVHVTYRRLLRHEIESGQGSPIGKPIPDLRAYLLDQNQQPVPIGVIGELYIGGAGVARGYLNRPELTAQRFVRDPFSPDVDARLYRTGDLGRWHEDGTIEYLGRNDQQVKIRGFRIELGEIEAQLLRQPQVREAVVLAREDVPGDKRLVAYVVRADAEDAINVDGLREHLSAALPDYMVPTGFVQLQRLPLTANGKLDRRALPAPDLGAYRSEVYEAPRGQVEESLAAIWQELLRVSRVSRRDNFFELGGHSLTASTLIVKVAERLHAPLRLQSVLRNPTLEALAGCIKRSQPEQVQSMSEFESGTI